MKTQKTLKKIIILFLSFAMIFVAVPVMAQNAKGEITEFYINPESGNDANNGSKDAPFKTMEKAVETVKKATKNMKGDIYVYFADGRYQLSEPIRLNANAGGNKDYKVYYKAMPGAKPIISGGQKVDGWEIYDSEKNIYRAKANGLYSRHFFVDGVMATRARSTGGVTAGKVDNGVIGFTCANVEMADWKNQDHIECVFIQSFYMRRRLVSSIKKIDEKTVQFDMRPVWNSATGTSTYVLPQYIENAYELLDEEGEFYIEPSGEYVYYKPLYGQDMAKAETYIGKLEELLIIGGYDFVSRTKNLVIDGLTFTELTWMQPTKDRRFNPAQDGYNSASQVNRTVQDNISFICPAAITIEKSTDIDFLNCEVKASGSVGIKIQDGSERINVIGNLVADLGGGGIYIGRVQATERVPADIRRTVKDVDVSNNYIHHVCKDNKCASGLSVAYPYNTRITHNEIHDTPYSAVHIGWDWQLVTEKTLKNLVVEYNFIHDFVKGANMGDGGGIYCVGYTSAPLDNPNKLINNYIKDGYLHSVQAGAMIYLDNTSSNYLIEGNVLDNIEGSKHWDGDAFFPTPYTPLNDLWLNNYTTARVDKYLSDPETNVIFEGNESYPTANWPKEARDVIRKSGLEPKYQHMNPRSKEYTKLYTDDKINIDPGESYTLVPIPSTEMCEEIKMDETSVVTFEMEDETVAKIDEKGVIRAIKDGKSELLTTVTIDGVTRQTKSTVSVGSGLATVQLVTDIPNKMIKGETKTLPIIEGINYGGTVIDGKLSNITYKSSNENILSVDNVKGTMTAKDYGEAALVFAGEFNGVTKETAYNIRVMDYADQKGLDYPATPIDELLEDSNAWYIHKGEMTEQINGLSFNGTNVAQYTPEKFDNVMFDFYMSLDKQATWPSVALRNQIECQAIYDTNAMYLICFAKTGIELQRFNGNDRTSIFCDLLPPSRIGPTHPMILEAGRKYHIQVGTFNEEGGVRIILNIDGVNIMNYLDEAPGRIENAGYFGFIVNNTTMNITTK